MIALIGMVSPPTVMGTFLMMARAVALCAVATVKVTLVGLSMLQPRRSMNASEITVLPAPVSAIPRPTMDWTSTSRYAEVLYVLSFFWMVAIFFWTCLRAS